MKNFFNKIREYPDYVNYKDETLYALAIAGAGLLMGFIAKATDGISVIGNITTDIGIWIFTAVLISVFSRTSILAAINMPIYFISMLLSYYAYGHFFLGFFPRNYAMAWLVIALISPIGGFIMWYSKSDSVISSIIASLPVAVLFAWGYPAFYTYQLPLVLDIFYAVTLIFLLPRSGKQKLVTAILSIALAFLLFLTNKYFNFPFGLIPV